MERVTPAQPASTVSCPMQHGVSERAFPGLPFALSVRTRRRWAESPAARRHGRSLGADKGRFLPGPAAPAPPAVGGRLPGQAPLHHRPLGRLPGAIRERGLELARPPRRGPASSLPAVPPEARAHGPLLPPPPRTHPRPRARSPAVLRAGARGRGEMQFSVKKANNGEPWRSYQKASPAVPASVDITDSD